MKKTKFAALALMLFSIVGVTSCGATTAEYALVTDVGDIDDQSFNQSCWEATKDFAKANGKTNAYYRPVNDSTEDRVASIEQAIQKGAKVIVCPGFLFEEAVYNVQDKYPEVKFVLIDGAPHTADYATYKTADNTVSIVYQEEISGFLAGFAAVKDGKTKLGFCGGMAVPAVQRFGTGFLQGVNAAAVEMGIASNVSVKYYYAGAFAATDAATALMKSWYTAGTECVFACGGKVYQSVVEGVKSSTGKTWIGVDVDQAKSVTDPAPLTSATKGLKESVTSALEVYMNEQWDDIGGKDYNLGLNTVFGKLAAKDYVGLPTDNSSWNFTSFTKDQYNALLSGIKNGTYTISGSTTAAPEVSITVDYVSTFTNAN